MFQDSVSDVETLRREVEVRRGEAARWGAFMERLAKVLDVPETKDFLGVGWVEDSTLNAVRSLVAISGPGAVDKLQQALDLVRGASDTYLMGSGAGAKEKTAQAAVILHQLVEGR